MAASRAAGKEPDAVCDAVLVHQTIEVVTIAPLRQFQATRGSDGHRNSHIRHKGRQCKSSGAVHHEEQFCSRLAPRVTAASGGARVATTPTRGKTARKRSVISTKLVLCACGTGHR